MLQHGTFHSYASAPETASLSPRNMAQLRTRCYFAFLCLDILVIVAGCATAGEIRLGAPFGPQPLSLALTIIPLFVLFEWNSYSAAMLGDWRIGAISALRSLIIAAGVMLFVGFALKTAQALSRLLIVYSLISCTVYLLAVRMAFGQFTRRLFGGSPVAKILVIDNVEVTRPADIEVLSVDYVDSDKLNDPFLLDRLARQLKGFDSVAVACRPESRAAWAMALKAVDVHAELLIPEFDDIGTIGMHSVAGVSTVLVSSGHMGARDRIVKRAMDLFVAIMILLMVLPLMLVTAIAIKLDSSGPVFFRQTRVGYGNRLFHMLKFRSMRTELEDRAGSRSASRDDDRVTRVGRFIRATSIDELPQLINVLRGEMSMVGPRPHALGSLAGDQLFWEVDAHYQRRHACKPGLTGLAQVRGFRGATHCRDDLVRRLHADLEYLNGWNAWRDVVILLLTVKVIVHRNAF